MILDLKGDQYESGKEEVDKKLHKLEVLGMNSEL